MTKLSLKISRLNQDILRLTGIPLGLLNQPITFDLGKTFHDYSYQKDGESHSFKTSLQYKSFLKLLDEPPKSKVFLFTGRQDYRRTRLLCVALLQSFRQHEFKPLWYLANGIFAKSVLQLKDNKALFIDSLSDEMTAYKYDKVHDICQRHCDKTIVLIHHGRDGFNVCVDRFGVNPSMVFNLDKTVGKKVISL